MEVSRRASPRSSRSGVPGFLNTGEALYLGTVLAPHIGFLKYFLPAWGLPPHHPPAPPMMPSQKH